MLLEQAADVEARLKHAIGAAGNRPERDPAVAAAAAELRRTYRQQLVQHPEQAREEGVDRHLWMRCVYTNIELYRRKVRKAHDFLQQSGAGADAGDVDQLRHRDSARDSLNRAAAGLSTTLDEARHFYEDLLAELQRLGGVALAVRATRGGAAAAGPLPPAGKKPCKTSPALSLRAAHVCFHHSLPQRSRTLCIYHEPRSFVPDCPLVRTLPSPRAKQLDTCQ